MSEMFTKNEVHLTLTDEEANLLVEELNILIGILELSLLDLAREGYSIEITDTEERLRFLEKIQRKLVY